MQRASGLLAVNLKLLDTQADWEAGGVSGQGCVQWECGRSECGRSECGRSKWTGVCVWWECGRSESGPSECGALRGAPRPAPASWVWGARRACPAAPPPGSAARGRVSGAIGSLGVLGVPSGAAAGAASVPAPLERQTRGAQAPAEPPAGGRRWARRASLARPPQLHPAFCSAAQEEERREPGRWRRPPARPREARSPPRRARRGCVRWVRTAVL